MSSSISELSSIPGQVLPSMSTEAGAAPRADGGLDLLLTLRRHIKLVALVFLAVLVVGGVALHYLFLKPLYSANSIVYVSPTFPAELAENIGEHTRTYDAFVEQQVKSVTRYETLRDALRMNPKLWQHAGESEQDAVGRLQTDLVVAQVGHSYEVSITLESRRGYVLAPLVNNITASYLEATRKDEVYGHDQRVATLNQEKAALQKLLDTNIRQQDQLLQDIGMAHFAATGGNPYDAQLTKLQGQLADAHEKRAEADAARNSVGLGPNASPKTLAAAADRQMGTDSSVNSMKMSLESRKATLLLQMAGLTPSNPLYQQSQEQIADIDKQMDQFTGTAVSRTADEIRGRTAADQASASDLENQLARDLSRTRAQAASAAPKLQQAQVLESEIDRIQRDYALVESRIENLSLEGESPGSVHLFSSAIPPSGPEKSKGIYYYGGLLLLSLIAGVAAAFIAEAVDPHVYTSGDVRRVVGFPPIGVLLNTTEFGAEVQKEYFLRLASGLDQAYRRAGARTFVFPSMGRTSTRELVQLVGSELAASGLHVLVVNVLSPTEAPEVDQRPRPELLGLHSGSTELATESNEPFRVVALHASEISDVLRRSRSYYNTILVAADPLFTSAYTEHYARIADGTVLIVDSGRTTKEELARAARLLERLKIKGIAIVLTGVTEKRADEDVKRTLEEYRWKSA
jgi:succinoglycan biosynthesis transport protein ExoP